MEHWEPRRGTVLILHLMLQINLATPRASLWVSLNVFLVTPQEAHFQQQTFQVRGLEKVLILSLPHSKFFWLG